MGFENFSKKVKGLFTFYSSKSLSENEATGSSSLPLVKEYTHSQFYNRCIVLALSYFLLSLGLTASPQTHKPQVEKGHLDLKS